MRILTVCTSTQIFGTEIASLNLLAAFKRRGFEQLAVTSTWTDGEFSKRLAALGIREVALPIGAFSKRISPQAMWWTLNAATHAPKLWLGWRQAISEFRPDVLLLTNPKQGLWVYAWLDMQPSFLIEHGMKARSTANRWMYRRLQKKLCGFVAVSHFMASHVQALGVARENVHVIYNCCPSGLGDIVNQSKSGATSCIRIGIAGQISPHKGYNTLIEAAVLLKKRGVNFKVLAFGAGNSRYVADLRQRVELAGLIQQWKWMGYAQDQDQMYGAMDICVMPSRFDEPFGLVALEASNHGLPVVAARRGGLPEIVVNGETGFLIDPENPADLAEKLGELASNRERASEMGENGQRRVLREFSEARMVAAYENLFRKAL